jgi:Leucine-rich repeat (LRR) protein
MRVWFVLTVFFMAVLLFGTGNLPKEKGTPQCKSPGFQPPGKPAAVVPGFAKVPLYFIANQGQVDRQARFYARTARYTLWVTAQGLIFDSVKNAGFAPSAKQRDVSRFIFLNANPCPGIVPEKPSAYRVNYLHGNDKSRWYTHIPTSERVWYKNLYKNIDLMVYGVEKEIEYDWIVKPAGNPQDIRFAYRNIKKSFIDAAGNLVIRSSLGEWIHQKPAAYQVINGKREAVEVAFIKAGNSRHAYGFKIAPYNRDYELSIDPRVVAFSSFLGGSDSDGIGSIAVDGSGSVIVAGGTGSVDFPTVNALYGNYSGYGDGFISKISPDGSALVFSTYLGGNNGASIKSVAVDGSGAIYVGGYTDSSNFPVVNAFQSTIQGTPSGFVSKLAADGASLIYSTYLGGDNGANIYDLAVNSGGEAYVTGTTYSTNFPVQNPIQAARCGDSEDAFVTKFSTSGSSLVYSTYLGGSDTEEAYGLAIDDSGAAYAGGRTASEDFPVYNAYQGTTTGATDGFISKISPDGSSLVFSTYLGGEYRDYIVDIDANNTGVFVTGITFSPDFPITAGAYDSTFNGDPISEKADYFISRLSSSGDNLIYSTYMSPSWFNTECRVVHAGPDGSAYAAGQTAGEDFPWVDGLKPDYYIGIKAFVSQLTPDGSTLSFSTRLSNLGSGDSYAYCIDVDAGGSIYLGGYTDENFYTYQGFQDTFGGSADGFVVKIISDTANEITVTAPTDGETWFVGNTETIRWTAPGVIENVKLEYSTDYGSTWTTIIDTTPNTGSYAWTIPAEDSSSCKVRVCDVEAPTIFTCGENYFFKISPSPIQVTSPNGGERWAGGSTHAITWLDNGSFETVSIAYTIDDGNTWTPVADSIPNTGSYDWTVADITTSTCKIKVSDPSGTPYDTSDNVFSIYSSYEPYIEVTSPNGGETWEAGTQHNITWISTAPVTHVSIDYSTDGGSSWLPVTDSIINTGSYNWTIPDTIEDRWNCFVRVKDSSSAVFDQNDDNFFILTHRTIMVTSPNGGEYWITGTSQVISWSYTGYVSEILIEYSTDNGSSWNTVTTTTTTYPSYGDYDWTIPDTPSTTCLVKVSHISGTPTDQSNAVFEIGVPRTVTVTSPNGGETWEGTTAHDITWTSAGAIANVKLEYSTNNGSSWNTIIDSTTNSGTYNWTVPNTPSSTYLVRVTDAAGTASDTSDAVFTITAQRTVTVTSPNGGETWEGTTAHDITWTSTGAIANVKIEYSTDSGGTWTTIIASTTNNGSYNWTVPNIASALGLIRISNIDGTPSDQSDAVFTITVYVPTIPTSERNALIALYNSTNGDSWITNTNWRKPGDPTQFNDPGTEYTWYGITCNPEHTHVERIYFYSNNLSGTLPTELNDLTYLKSLSLRNDRLTGSIVDLSSLTQLRELYLDKNQLSGNIPTWLNNLTQMERIYLDENQFSGPIPDLGNLTNLTNLLLYNNQLTGTIPSWLNNLTNLGSLQLGHNQLTGTIPDLSNLSELIYLGLDSNHLTGTIPTWLNNLTGLQHLILYSNDLTGTIPDLSDLTNLTILDLATNGLTGEIPAWINNFTELNSLYLGGNEFQGNIPDLSGLTKMSYLYLEGNSLTGPIPPGILNMPDLSHLCLYANRLEGSIPSNIGNLTHLRYLLLWGNNLTGSIPASITNLTNLIDSYGINLTWNGLYTDDSGIRDFVDSKQVGGNWENTQTIAPTGLTVNEITGDSVNISWTPILYQADPGGYRVYYSTTSGGEYTLAGTTADKTVDNFTVTGLNPSQTYYFVVKAFTNSGSHNQSTVVSDYSIEVSATTAEAKTLTVTSPNGGETWEGTTAHNITWTSTGAIANVKLEYSTNNGSSWNTISASTANSGTYDWTVPNTPSTTCLVRITDTAGPATDTGDAVFTITAQRTITVTAPNGGETWEGTTAHNITWTSTGAIANVKLEYSTNNGSSWNTISASTANSGTYNWTVPNTPSTNCLVKVSDTAGPAVDQGNGVFTISAQRTITVTTPNGGQRWFIDTIYAIAWSSTGSISNVMIEYSTNSGSSWNTIIASTSNTGTYNWTIPNTPSANCLVRISDTSGTASDVSDSVFTIDPYPTVTVTAPNGGETWIAYTTHAITWTNTGTIATVNLEYSTNNGTSWTSIATSVTNTGSYNWVIPYISSTNCLVRVSDTATTAADTSNAVFTLELPPSLTVTSPNGGESWVKRSTHTITWTWTGTVGNVKIEYTLNGGSSWTTITSSTPNDGSHQWTLPNVTSTKTQCLVKITAINGSAVDTSDAYFTILK